MRRNVPLMAVAVIALVVLGSSVVGCGRPISAAAAAANVDWPHFGNNTDNNHFSPLTQVNISNVDKLAIAWTMQEGKNLSSWETDPVVVGGTMYLTTNTDQVIAVNAATGAVRW